MSRHIDNPPKGYTAVTPWIITTDTAKLLDFMGKAFGAKELARVPNPDGKGIGHAEAKIGDAVVMSFDAPEGWPPTPAFIRLFVDDVDQTFKAALKAGAKEVTKPTLLAFGDKVGRVRDPFGNIWWLQQRVEDVGTTEAQKRFADPAWSKSMQYVQSSLAQALR